ncbi:MAG: tungstate ABC transporter substrate-binding protein WtpA [Desulfovermiculus sp.]
MQTRVSLFCALCLGVLLSLCSGQALAKEKLIIFHAGSLAVPMEKMEKEFEQKYPEIDVQREVGGSTKMARLISGVGKPADIMASADYKVIDDNLIPEHAAWNIRFASNELVLTYTEQSRYAGEVDSDNWYEILQRDDVEWGHSDPDLDPCGYRALMVLQLAEKFYEVDGLYKDLIANRPEKNIRPKSVELVNLLKSGHMDYAWEYLSVAVQHDLQYITLDEHINLGNYRNDNFYKQAQVEVSGKEPGTQITKHGQSVTYGVTMTNDAPNPEAAIAFLQYMLDEQGGLQILEEMGQPPFVPARIPDQDMMDELPEQLHDVVVVKE